MASRAGIDRGSSFSASSKSARASPGDRSVREPSRDPALLVVRTTREALLEVVGGSLQVASLLLDLRADEIKPRRLTAVDCKGQVSDGTGVIPERGPRKCPVGIRGQEIGFETDRLVEVGEGRLVVLLLGLRPGTEVEASVEPGSQRDARIEAVHRLLGPSEYQLAVTQGIVEEGVLQGVVEGGVLRIGLDGVAKHLRGRPILAQGRWSVGGQVEFVVGLRARGWFDVLLGGGVPTCHVDRWVRITDCSF